MPLPLTVDQWLIVGLLTIVAILAMLWIGLNTPPPDR